MTVSAHTAKDLAVSDNGLVDMRGGTPVRAGTYPYEGDDLATGWHHHDLHQLEYAFEGVVEVETETAHYLLPPQQAAWIPAELSHRTTIKHHAKTLSVFFDPGLVPSPDEWARILPAAPLIKEMILYAARWPILRSASDPVADGFFETLAHLVLEWLDRETPLCLPTSREPVVAMAMEYTNRNLSDVSLRDVCEAIGFSERTLRRRFSAETGISWRTYLLHSRLLRSMSLLAEPGTTVLDIATAVGFDSLSSFTRAFTRWAGETPSAYRRRLAHR